MELNQSVKINLLLSLYGNLLNKNQQTIMQRYFVYDTSMSEIAEEFGITRQAVSDLIKRVEKLLFAYEEKLQLMQKYNKSNQIIEELLLQETNNKTKSKLLQLQQILED